MAFAIQALIFPWGKQGPLIPFGTAYLHLLSYVPVLAFVLLNRRHRGLVLMGLGILLNLLVIAVNGGYMPVSESALAAAGKTDLLAYLKTHGVSGNVMLMSDRTRLAFLGDNLFLPPQIPFATAFSIGDLLIGVGICAFIASAMGPRGRSALYRPHFVQLLQKMANAESLEQIAEAAIRYAVSLMPEATAGSFLWWDDREGVYRYVAAVGWDMDKLRGIAFKPEELLQVKLGARDKPVIVRNPEKLHRKFGNRRILELTSPHAMPAVFLSVPISYGGEVKGYFNIDSDKPHAFTGDDLELMRYFRQEIELVLALYFKQRELHEKQEQLQILFEHAPDAIFVTDYEGNILDCNEAASQQTGYSKDELKRMNILELAIDPPPVEEINARLQRGEKVVFEEAKRRRDGSVYYTEVAISPIKYGDRPMVLSFNRDITERKVQEERMYKLWMFSRELFQARGEEDICRKTAVFCQRLFGTKFCGVYLRKGDRLHLVGWAGERGSWPDELPIHHGRNGPKISGDVFAATLFSGDIQLGSLVVEPGGKPSEYVRRLLDLLALQVANALQVRRYTERLETFADRLEKLHRAVTRFNQAESEKELCDIAVDVLQKLLGFDYGAVALREGDYLVPVSYTTTLSGMEPRKFRLDEGLGGLTYTQRKTFWGKDVQKEPRAKPVSQTFRAFISVPVGDFGIIQIVSMRAGAFGPEDVKLVEILAQQLYEALKRIRLEADIKEQAIRDPLTGLHNRRYYDFFVRQHMKHRPDQPLGIAIVDMDNFKTVNDTCGHIVGDEVLKELAQILQKNVRNEDLVIRWGGDEFLVLMPGATREEVSKIVERLRAAVSAWEDRPCPGVEIGLTAGISSWDPSSGRDIEDCLREADRELYAKKRQP